MLGDEIVYLEYRCSICGALSGCIKEAQQGTNKTDIKNKTKRYLHTTT